MSQICDYNDKDLEKLSLYARNLRPMLRESAIEEDEIDLSHVVLSHYRLSKIRQQDIQLKEDVAGYELEPGDAMGSAKAKDPQEEFLSQIVARLNELFITDELTDNDMVNYAQTVKDKVMENARVMQQISENTAEQAMLGDFPGAMDDAIMNSSEAHQNQMMQLLSDPAKNAQFQKLIFEMLATGQNKRV
jgi:type I restriction enzyme R subunit